MRHQMVTGTASPDDPALADYWTSRRRRPRLQPPVDHTTQRLLHSQHGRCVLCGQLLLHADHPPQTPQQWEQCYGSLRKAMDHNAISLTNRHPGPSGPLTVPGAGMGLIGLGERVTLAGGRIEYGVHHDTFRLHAWLPWPP